MENNKETIKMYISEASALNQMFSKCKFPSDITLDTISSLMNFKFKVSKINDLLQEFIKSSTESIKTDRFNELSSKDNRNKKEEEEFKVLTKELTNKLNKVINDYLAVQEDIEITKVDTEDFYKFCKENSLEMQLIELLYKKLV